MPIVDFYNLPPHELKAGDVMVVTVTLHVAAIDKEGKPAFSMYRCPWPRPQIGEEGIPQGDRILTEHAGMAQKALFPVVSYRDGYPTPY